MAAKKAPKAKRHHLQLVAGVEGTALYLNNYRIAGPKPWGGGVVRDEWVVTDEDLNTAVKRG